MEQLNSSICNSSNASTFSPPLIPSWDRDGITPGIVMSLCFLLGVPGNVAVMVDLRRNQQLCRLSKRIIWNLALSDLLLLLSIPVWTYDLIFEWPLDLALCKIFILYTYCSIYSSLLTVTLLGVQRYLQVFHPKNLARLGQAGERGLLVALWGVAGVLSIPWVVVYHVIENKKGLLECEPSFSSDAQEVALMLTETLLGFVVPFSIMATSYFRLHRKVNKTAFFNNPRMTKLVISIIITFFILWSPLHVINLLVVTAILLRKTSLIRFCETGRNFAQALAFINSTLDPLLYAFSSRSSQPESSDRQT